MALILIWGIIGVFVVLQSHRHSFFSRFERKNMDPSPVEPAVSTESSGKKMRLANPRKFIEPYRNVISALTQPTKKSLALFIGVTGLALGTGIIALFVVMPLIFTAVLSVLSFAALVPAISSARIRFFPSGRAVMEDTAPPAPEKEPPSHIREPEIEQDSGDEPEPSDMDKPEHGILTRYPVTPPYSSVKIVRMGNAGFTYTIIEPPLLAREKTILRETYAYLRDVIIYDDTGNSIEKHINPAVIYPVFSLYDPTISKERLDVLYYYLKRDLSGYGPLEVLMRDSAIEDMSCNGKDLPVFIFHRVYGSLPTSVVFSEGELNQFVLKIAQKANKQVSLSNPMVDATLPDGARIQITYSDVVSTKGSSFTIRKFREEPMTPLDLINLKTYDPEILAFLWLAIEHHKSLIIAGGTASGKTSTMNAVSLFIPQNAKIVSLEDTREIQLPHKNWLPTQTRELTATGVKGDDIDLFSLLKACMRQRPEYIIVGEVRGHEAQTLFQAMNTGHATLSTIHAGSVQEAINRLTHDPINVSPVMFSALDLIVIQSLYSFGNTRIRRCLSIHEIEVDMQGGIRSTPLYEWDMESDTFIRVNKDSRVLADIASHRGWSAEETRRQLDKRVEFFSLAVEVPRPDIRDLANAIHNLSD